MHSASLSASPSCGCSLAVRRGVTVLELLIVMTILLMITAATIPLMTPALQNRRMREASRLVSSFISGARSRAIETGRPVGVRFQRLNGIPAATVLSYVEVPQDYAGDTPASKVIVASYPVRDLTILPPASNIIGYVSMVSDFPAKDVQWLGLASYGDTIRLNHREPRLTLGAITTSFTYDMMNGWYIASNSLPQIDLNAMGGSLPIPTPPPDTSTAPVGWILFDKNTNTLYNPPSGYSSGVAFSIERRPTRFSSPPLQLPEGVVVDLYASGVGQNDTFAGIDPVSQTLPQELDPKHWRQKPPLGFDPIVMFAANGRVDHVTINSPELRRPSGAVFFLVGRRELMADVSSYTVQVDENIHDPRDPNLPGPPPKVPAPTFKYLENFWITISPQTGFVSVSEMARNPPASNTSPSVAYARSIAIQNQGVGGR